MKRDVYKKGLKFFQPKENNINIEVQEKNGTLEVKTLINNDGELMELETQSYNEGQLRNQWKY